MLFIRTLLVLVTVSGVLAEPRFGEFYRHRNGGNHGGGNGGNTSAAADTAAAVSSATDTATAAAAAAATTTSAASGSNNAAAGGSGGGGGGAVLLASNIQSGSDSDGGAAIEAGQSPSLTDPDNFINFCTGQTLTNGLQVTAGSCNGVVMGQIPSSSNMISTIITSPAPGANLAANTNFTVNLQVQNLIAGSFTNPNTTYYSAPQKLSGGKVVGHTHVTIQDLGGSLAPSTPPDPATFAFFKGVDNAGDGTGGLNVTVAGGLPAGSYRVCTLTSSSNHKPVLMPVAQRGAQDDCTKFTVGGGGAGSSSHPAGQSAATNASVGTGRKLSRSRVFKV